MKTPPTLVTDNARAGRPFFLLEITPAAADTWGALRWSELPAGIDDDAFESGILTRTSVPSISEKADIRDGGAAASTDAITLALVDKLLSTDEYLHAFLQDNEIEGREITVWIALESSNPVRNASFEFGGATPDNWSLEVAGGVGSAWTRSAADSDHRTYSLKIETAILLFPTAPIIKSSTFKVNTGARDLVLTYRANASSAGIDSEIAISVGGFYWNDTAQVWGVGRVMNVNTHAATGWQTVRYTIPMDLIDAFGNSDAFIELSMEDILNESVFFDSIQVQVIPRDHTATPDDFAVNRRDYEADDVFKVYRGEVRSHRWRHNRIQVKTRSIVSKRHTDIPITKISNRFATNWDIDPELEGIPFPMTYGDLSFKPYGDDPGAAAPVVDRFDYGEDVDLVPRQLPVSLAKCVMVNTRNNNRALPNDVILYVDRPGMKLNELGFVHHYDAEMNRYIRELLDDQFSSPALREWAVFPDEAKIDSSPAPSGLPIVDNGQVLLSVYQRFTRSTSSFIGGPWGGFWVSEYRLGQGNFSGRARARLFGSAAGSLQKFNFTTEVFKLHDVELIAVYVLAEINLLGAYGAGSVYIDVTVTDGTVSQTIRLQDGSGTMNNSPFTADDGTITPTHGETQFPITMNDTTRRFDWWNSPEDSDVVNGFHHFITSKTQADDEVYMHDLTFRLDLTININDFVPFVECKGREYLDTWGARKTAGTLIENPADVIEGVLRDELGVAGADIDTAAFDAANTDRAGWKFAGQLTEQDRSENVVDQLAQDGAFIYFVDVDGKESIRALGYGTEDATLGIGDFELNSIEFGYTDREEVVNDFTVLWGWNPDAEAYMSQSWVSRHGSSLDDPMDWVDKCIDSYTRLGNIEKQRGFEARWIQDQATADLYLKFLVDWLRVRKRTLKGNSWLTSLGLELGDRIKLKNFGQYIGDEDTAIFVVENKRIRKGSGTFELSLLEVIDGTVNDVLRAWVTNFELEVHY